MNSLQDRKRVGTWLKEEILKERPSRAIVWPAEPTLADSLLNDAGVEKVLATSPGAIPVGYEDLEEVHLASSSSHEVAKQIPESSELEYGWALAHDTVNSIEEGLSKEEAQRKIIDTSETLLQPGGYAVYNLESAGSRPRIPVEEDLSAHENMIKYGREMMEILQEDYTDHVELYEDPEFHTYSPHLVWRKPE